MLRTKNQPPRPELGTRLPDVELVDHNGDPWRISDHEGSPLVLILHRHLA